MKHKLKHLQSLVAVALCVIMAMAFTSCSDDDDEPSSDNLAGSKWEVISATDEDVKAGLTIEFKNDGNCVLTPRDWWNMARKLKIMENEKHPHDDYMEGQFSISDKTATYTYSWYDCGGKWGGEKTYSMTLRKK